MNRKWCCLLVGCLIQSVVFASGNMLKAGVYEPCEGGFHISLPDGYETQRPAQDLIGVTSDNARLHRRPLYPPADKSLIWNERERERMIRFGYRPLVLAYNEPRFLFDFHSAGGLLGHLYAGLNCGDNSKWFHQWANLEVTYARGQMQYVLTDPVFPGVTVRLEASALAGSDGLILHIEVLNLRQDASLVWGYGGASAFFTNYNMTAPQFVFAPEQCAKDRIVWEGRWMALHRKFDKSDGFMSEPFAVGRHLPKWEAVIRGGGSWKHARHGTGAPEAFMESPKKLLDQTQWADSDTQEQSNGVAVEEISLSPYTSKGYVIIGMGGEIERALRKPHKAWKESLARNREIAERIVVETPDPYLNAAATMMAFATDGTWGDSTVMHGGWSWRFGYLGWRGWYGSNCYGWTDRIRKAIKNYLQYGLIHEGEDAGALSSLLDTPGGVFYNMNEVFWDQVRQYFEYTNDVELMREIFPVLEGIAAWENRRLQPENAALYENSLNTWISDSHWYIQGQCTQASAYMLRAHLLLADLAKRLGKDPAPYAQQAEKIREAMQKTLWMPGEGVFAEFLDTRGHRLLHTQPELPTIYHSAEFGAADAAQIMQMLTWAYQHLRASRTPNDGCFFYSSNWFPNAGRSYTHSTYEMAYAEELNFALTHYLAGRSEEAYDLFKATYCGIFNGPTPGGLSCHSFADGKQRANDEFSDAISMWGRTLVEGVFGIMPKRPDQTIEVSPQLPKEWPSVFIHTPMFSYRLYRCEKGITIDWESPVETKVNVRIPVWTEPSGRVWLKEKEVRGVIQAPVNNGPWWLCASSDIPAKNGYFRLEVAMEKAFAYDKFQPKTDFFNEPCPGPARESWKIPDAGNYNLARWSLLDLNGTFNTTINGSLEKVEKEATPPPSGSSTVGYGYWKSHLGARHHGDPVQVPSDAAWRAKVDPQGVAWTTDGIPFKTVKEGFNIGIVTQAGAFPTQLSFPANVSGKTLYLMLSGMSFPVQSHMPHLRITLQYADGCKEERDLYSPCDIGDGWSTWCGRWHDTPNAGFENLGGRFGPAGSKEVADLTQPVNVDTEAHLVAFALKTGAVLSSVELEAVANDIIFGIMGATVLK